MKTNRLAALVIVAAAMATPCMAIASSCLSRLLIGSDNPVQTAVELSDVVFIGDVQFVEVTTSQVLGSEELVTSVSATFAVKEILKGQQTKELIVTATDVCHCRHRFAMGVEYVIMGSLSDQKIVPHFCQFIRPSDSPTVEAIRAAITKTEDE